MSSGKQDLGSTITGWLLSEFTAKSAQQSNGHSTTESYSSKKADGNVSEYGIQKLSLRRNNNKHHPRHRDMLEFLSEEKRPATPKDITVVEEITISRIFGELSNILTSW